MEVNLSRAQQSLRKLNTNVDQVSVLQEQLDEAIQEKKDIQDDMKKLFSYK